MRWALIFLLVCSCGFAAPWVDTDNAYLKVYRGSNEYEKPWAIEREDGVLLFWVDEGEPYEYVISLGLVSEWPDGDGSREIRVLDAELWQPANDAVDTLNEEAGWAKYGPVVSRVDW